MVTVTGQFGWCESSKLQVVVLLVLVVGIGAAPAVAENHDHRGARAGPLPDSCSVTIFVEVCDDSYVNSEEPDRSYGSDEELRTGRGALEYRGYLKFDLSLIPAGKPILSGRLRLYGRLANVEGSFVGAHYLEDDSWDESTLTWNNAPSSFSSTAADTIEVHTGFNYWVVTEDVNAAYRDDGMYSVVLKLSDGIINKWAYFYSQKELFVENWPWLEVEYESVKYGGGSGTAEDPYLIYTAQQLSQIGDNHEDWDKHFKLMADLDLSAYTGRQFHVISTDWQEPFTGVFDGNGHVISNFTHAFDGFVNYVGLFGCVGTNGQVKELGLADPCVSVGSGNGAGALAGSISGGVVERCWARGVQVSGNFRVGGLVGEVYEGQLVDSYVQGGDVFARYNYVGGLVGENADRIVRCYSTCRPDGEIAPFGGLVGYNNGGSVVNSFWDREASGRTWSHGGTAKFTDEMQTRSTFTNAGWDFVGETENGTADYWRMCVDGESYPLLWWQFTSGDFLCPDGVNFVDYSFLAGHWQDTNCSDSNDCDRTDLDFSGTVDWADLKIFCEHWLEGIK